METIIRYEIYLCFFCFLLLDIVYFYACSIKHLIDYTDNACCCNNKKNNFC